MEEITITEARRSAEHIIEDAQNLLIYLKEHSMSGNPKLCLYLEAQNLLHDTIWKLNYMIESGALGPSLNQLPLIL